MKLKALAKINAKIKALQAKVKNKKPRKMLKAVLKDNHLYGIQA